MKISKGTLYKRGNVWWFAIRCDGKKVQKSLHTSIKEEALARFKKIKEDLLLGISPSVLTQKQISFFELVNKYEEFTINNKSKNTVKREKGILEKVKNYFGNCPVNSITQSKIEEYLIDKYSNIQEMKPCIPTSQNTISHEEEKLIEKGKYRPNGNCEYPKVDTICPVCYFLGANGLVGFVSIPFLYTDNSAELMYSVRIDRAKGTAADRTNRDYQVLPQGSIFKGDIEIILEDTVKGWKLGQKRKGLQRDVDKWLDEKSVVSGEKFSEMTQKDLIKEFIEERFKEITQLGGFKSKGAGKVKIERVNTDDTG